MTPAFPSSGSRRPSDSSHSDDSWETSVRSQFPILDQRVHGHPLDYLDTAATSQKPLRVINAESAFYATINAGVHRGTHELAVRSTLAFEQARRRIAALVNADGREGHEEIVFTQGATASLNLLAAAFGYASWDTVRGVSPTATDGVDESRFALRPGDEIVVSEAEHHSVLLSFQELARRTGARLKWFGVSADGRIRSDQADTLITPRTRVVAVTAVSNVTGAVTDLGPIVGRAHEVGALVVLDLCQAVPHLPIDVKALDCDFAAWSGHKMYGPTGIGFLYGKRELLEALPPAQFGGEMVDLAYLDAPAQYSRAPYRFEAGTQPVAQAVGAGVAALWMRQTGIGRMVRHEAALTEELLKVKDIPGVRVLGPTDSTRRVGTVAFDVEGVHPHDVGQYLDSLGIAIRTGHHCAQPIHRHFGVQESNRASVGPYTSKEDVRRLVEAVRGVRPYFLGKE